MINLDRLQDEAYALKVLVFLIGKYFLVDSERIENINTVASIDTCIPGRAVGRIFYQKKLDANDKVIIQEIINIFS